MISTYLFFKHNKNKYFMVGRVGYAPTTPAMSMQYSTIELTAHKTKLKTYFLYLTF